LHWKVKLSLCLSKKQCAMKMHGEEVHYLDFGTRWWWMVIFMPLPSTPRGRMPRYPLDSILGGRYVGAIILSLPGDSSIVQPVTNRYNDLAALTLNQVPMLNYNGNYITFQLH
jgi:hypothetical protein